MTLAPSVTKKFLNIKLGITHIKHVRALEANFSASPTLMNNVSLKTLQTSSLGWDIGTNPATGRGLGVTPVCLCSRTGTAARKMIMGRGETVSC